MARTYIRAELHADEREYRSSWPDITLISQCARRHWDPAECLPVVCTFLVFRLQEEKEAAQGCLSIWRKAAEIRPAGRSITGRERISASVRTMKRRQGLLLLGSPRVCRTRKAWSFLVFSFFATVLFLWLANNAMTYLQDSRSHSNAVRESTAGSQWKMRDGLKRLIPVENTLPSAEEDDDSCPVFKLIPGEKLSDKVTCKRADFEPGSCRIMKLLFSGNPANCTHQQSDVVCEIKDYNPENPQIDCHHDVCMKSSSVSVGLYEHETGQHQWHDLNSIEKLAAFITSELLVDFKILHHGYCFIRCLNPTGRQITQLLILPPFLNPSQEPPRRSESKSPLLNVNILLLDSVSRHHFYRMMPQTINAFRNLNGFEFTNGRVFDFEMVQGIRGRTFESLEALFSGIVDLLPFFDPPPKSVDLNETLGRFKAFGYETLYVEDLCWLWEWGLVTEQRALNLAAPFYTRAKLFNRAIKHAGIDRVDVSYTSCSILQENNIRDMFHGPSAICYNGFHQHAYLLQYMEYFMTRFSSLKKPTFTFLILDTGHEDTGIRIKQLDVDLAKHVYFLANQKNTVSFILSDHGNTYGRFVDASAEAQVEVFHPMLFVVIPNHAAVILGDRKMKSLHLNQNRLISLLDVHYTLKGLLPSVESPLRQKPKGNVNINGLLSPVSANRSCEDIPRIHPNLCICQGYYISKRNDSYHALFAEFALGHMNKRILQQQKGAIGHCTRLTATRFEDVKSSRESPANREIIVKFDLYVKSTKSARHKEERFAVSIQFSFVNNMEVMIFLGYERMSPYRVYQSCADPSVDIRLCICNRLTVQRHSSADQEPNTALRESVLWTVTHRTPVHRPCLYLLTRNYTSGVALSVRNACSKVRYHLHFDFLTQNMFSSNKMPVTQAINPRMETLLVVGIRKVKSQPWRYKYILNYTTFTL